MTNKFVDKPDGIYYIESESSSSEFWICSKLEVIALTRDDHGKEWGRLLRFVDPDGNEREWAMPMSMLAGDGSDCRRELLNNGVSFAPNQKARNLFIEYLSRQSPKDRVLAVSRLGWYNSAYVLPDCTFGSSNSKERIALQTISSLHQKFKTQGSLIDWQINVASLCSGNTRLEFAVSLALAPVLLNITREESGGYHFRSSSSTGKTSALRVAGSVWGGGGINGFIEKWRATTNALESIALGHCDSLLILDELAQVEAKDAGQIAYMLANQSGKRRSDKTGASRPSAEWRILFLSSGEISLEDHMSQAGQQIRAGQETRMVDIPADAQKGMGLFEDIHNSFNSAVFSKRICENASQYYGTAIREFISQLIADHELASEKILNFRNSFKQMNTLTNENGQVSRVADRFSLVGAAGELAIHYKVLPWAPGDALNAASVCFKSWLENRGTSQDSEIPNAIAYIRGFLQENSNRFLTIKEDGDYQSELDGARNTKIAGFKRKTKNDETEWLVFPKTFKTELCKGFDSIAVARNLVKRGFIRPGKDGKTSRTERIPDAGSTRMYCITSKIMEVENGETSVTGEIKKSYAKSFNELKDTIQLHPVLHENVSGVTDLILNSANKVHQLEASNTCNTDNTAIIDTEPYENSDEDSNSNFHAEDY